LAFNSAGQSADAGPVQRVNFFDGGLSHEQLKIGLVVAAIALSSAFFTVALLVIPHHTPVDWDEVGIGFATLGIVIAYLAVNYAALARRHSRPIDPRTVLVMVLACLVTISLVNVAADGSSWTYQPLFFEVPIFVSLIGNPTMRYLTLASTVTAVAVTLGSLAHHFGAAQIESAVMFAACLVAVERMIGAVMTTLRGRNAARGIINVMMQEATGARSMDEGLRACLPLVDGVVPAKRVAVVRRSSAITRTDILASWTATRGIDQPAPANFDSTTNPPAPDLRVDHDDLPWALADPTGEAAELHAAVVGATAVINPNWCVLPIGYSTEGELLLLIERRPTAGYGTRFAQEAADALAACFLRLTGRLSHLARLQQESVTDALTGLPNRRLLEERLELEMARCARYSLPFVVAMLDLDRFKEYNDDLGHAAGDKLLRTVAAALSEHLRPRDLAARYGGDEFCLVMPETTLTEAASVLDGLRKQVRTMTAGRQVTLSAGLAVWDGSATGDELVARADIGLYEAKRAGRDQVVAARAANDIPTVESGRHKPPEKATTNRNR